MCSRRSTSTRTSTNSSGQYVDANGAVTATPVAATRTYYSLTGLGLGTGLGTDGNLFDGIEYGGIENLQVRLNDTAVDNFTITQTHPGSPTVVLGGGNDNVIVNAITGPTTILGGPGDDNLYLEDPKLLAGLGGRLVFNGDATIVEQSETVKYSSADHDPALTTAPYVFVGSTPNLSIQDGASPPNTFNYAQQFKDRILLKSADPDHPSDTILWVYVVSLQNNGTLYEDLVQERGVQEYGVQERGVQKSKVENGVTKLLWYDANGAETTDPTSGLPVVVAPNT